MESKPSVITLQLGDAACAVGSRFWSMQEVQGAHPGDAMHRWQGCGDTLVPRVVSVGMARQHVPVELETEESRHCPPKQAPSQGGIGQWSRIEETIKEQWEGPVERMERITEPGWETWMRHISHPKSFLEAKGIWDSGIGMAGYGQGSLVGKEDSFLEQLQDRVRWFTEECDHLQTFQLLVEETSAFEGIAAEFLPILKDDYPGLPVSLFSIKASENYYKTLSAAKNTKLWTTVEKLNAGLANAAFIEYCDVVIPLKHKDSYSGGLKYISLDKGFYQTSAIMATAIDSATLPYRMEADGDEQMDLSASQYYGMLKGGQQAPYVALSASLPCQSLDPLPKVVDPRQKQDPSPYRKFVDCEQLSPVSFKESTSVFSEHYVLRGAQHHGQTLTRILAQSYLDDRIMREAKSRICSRTVCPYPVYFPFNFPLSISLPVQKLGAGDPSTLTQSSKEKNAATAQAFAPESLSMLSVLSSTDAFGPYLSQIQSSFQAAAKTGQGRVMLDSWQISSTDLEDSVSKLHHLVLQYDEEIGSDDYDD